MSGPAAHLERRWRILTGLLVAVGVQLVGAAVAAACTGGADWPRLSLIT